MVNFLYQTKGKKLLCYAILRPIRFEFPQLRTKAENKTRNIPTKNNLPKECHKQNYLQKTNVSLPRLHHKTKPSLPELISAHQQQKKKN